MGFIFLALLFYIALPIFVVIVVVLVWSNSQKKSAKATNNITKENTYINHDNLSSEQKLALYYNQLTSPKDKSVIIDFANYAGIDLDNPKSLSANSLAAKQQIAAATLESSKDRLVYQEQTFDTESSNNILESTEEISHQPAVHAHSNVDSANYLLFAGAALIVVALLFFANAASETFGTGVRFIALLISSVFLFGAGVWVYNFKKALRPVGSAFIWISILSVPAIGFSLYKDIFDSSQASLSWFITSLIGLAYILLAYKLLKTSQFLEYLTYAASLNMLLATVSIFNTDVKLYTILGLVYSIALIVIDSKGFISNQKSLPLSISILVAALSSVVFGASIISNFSYSEAMWLGLYGLILSAYIISLAKLYKNDFNTNSIYSMYAFCGFILPWSVSLIISSIISDFTSYFSVIPIAITSLVAAILLSIKNYGLEFYKNWIVVATILALSSAIASPNANTTAVIYGAYSLIMLFVSIKKRGMFAPSVALFGIPVALLIANSSSSTLDFIAALSLSTALSYLLGVALVFLKTINQKTIAILSCILWSISFATLISQGYFAEAGIMLAAGAVTMLVWQRQFYPFPLMNVALPLSISSPLIGFINSNLQLECYLIGIFIFLLWTIAVRYYRILFKSPWFVTYIITSSIFNVLAFMNLSSGKAAIIIAINSLLGAVFLYLGHNLYQWIRALLSINLIYSFLLAVLAFAYFIDTNVNMAILLAAMSVYIIAYMWPIIVKNKVLQEHKLSTYIRIADIAALLILSFVPLFIGDDLANKTMYASLAVIASGSLMAEGFILKRGILRYSGSLVVMLTVLQLIWVLGVNNIHIYSHVVGVYLLGLAYAVYTYRNRKDIADNLILGSVLLVLIVLSLDALGGSTAASLAVLIESSIIALIAGLFRHKPALIASIAILIVSIVYRASSFLASIPTWVWYLLVGVGLITAAAYMLNKNSKK